MPRRARLNLAGVPWDIVQRGNNRSACFFAEQDYRLYLQCLQKLARRFDCAVHSGCQGSVPGHYRSAPHAELLFISKRIK